MLVTTPKTAIHHNMGDAEFGSPETPQWTGRVPALSEPDVTHRGKAAAYMLTTTLRHVNTTQSAPKIHQNLFQKSSSSQHVSLEVTNWKNLTSKTPEGRSVTFWVQGSDLFFFFSFSS